MILQKDYTATVLKYKEFQDKIDAFKAFTDANDLPFTTDYKSLVDKLKMNLFNQLLTVDNGLALRYNTLLKSHDAKEELVNTTINISGYDEPLTITRFLTELNRYEADYNSEFNGSHKLYLESLFKEYAGKLDEYLKQYIISFEGLEKECKLVDEYVSVLNKLLKFNDETGQNFLNLDAIKNMFDYALEVNRDGIFVGKVSVDKVKLYNGLKHLRGME